MYALPDDIERAVTNDESLDEDQRVGTLRLFYITAQNWDDWEYYGVMRKGMRRLCARLDQEYHDEAPNMFEPLDYTMPTKYEPSGRDWRMGTFNFQGEDTDSAPLDIQWSLNDIESLAGGDNAAVS